MDSTSILPNQFSYLAIEFSKRIEVENIDLYWHDNFDFTVNASLFEDRSLSVNLFLCTELRHRWDIFKDSSQLVALDPLCGYDMELKIAVHKVVKSWKTNIFAWEHQLQDIKPRLDSNVFVLSHKDDSVMISELYHIKQSDPAVRKQLAIFDLKEESLHWLDDRG